MRPFVLAAGGNEGGKAQVSVTGGLHPMWSRTARELFFSTSDGHLMVAGYKTSGTTFEAEKPRVWSNVH